MTREEAVKILKSILAYDSDFAKAKQMAIEALEQEPKRGEWLNAREEDPCCPGQTGNRADRSSDYRR